MIQRFDAGGKPESSCFEKMEKRRYAALSVQNCGRCGSPRGENSTDGIFEDLTHFLHKLLDSGRPFLCWLSLTWGGCAWIPSFGAEE